MQPPPPSRARSLTSPVPCPPARQLSLSLSQKRNGRIKAEEKLARQIHRKDVAESVRRRAEEGMDSEVFRAGYDSVVAASKLVLEKATMELRKPKSDMREDRRAMCWTCGRVYCECPEEISVAYNKAIKLDENGEPIM